MLPSYLQKNIYDTGDCWEWLACLNHAGYGKTIYKGEYWQAHRLVYTLIKGEIPAGLQLDHMCFNKKCVNPSHLYPATSQQNGFNRKGANKNSATGIRGVGKYNGRYRARFTLNRKEILVGYFDTIEEAEQAIIRAREGVLS